MASVKRTFDVEYQVRERPWLMMSAAAAAGFVASRCALTGPGISRTQPKDNSSAFGSPSDVVGGGVPGNDQKSHQTAPVPSANDSAEHLGPATHLRNQLQ